MSKIILEFDGANESIEAREALDGWKWKHSMWQLDQWLRNEIKHNDGLNSEASQAYDDIREKIREILSDDNLNLEP